MENVILNITNLSKYFGGVRAVDDFSLSLTEGSIQAIIGPNGAGKTTIFNLITGLYKPTAGEIFFNSHKIDSIDTFRIAEMGIARTFQNIRLFPEFSVLDNVRTACHSRANYSILEGLIPTRRRIQQEKQLTDYALELLRLVKLDNRANDYASNLSYGHRRRLEIARAMAIDPRLLLLDEPAAGMNPDETQKLMEFIAEIHEKFNLTILLIEHHMEVVMGLAYYITVIDFGKTIANGTPDEIQSNPVVIAAYLGVGE